MDYTLAVLLSLLQIFNVCTAAPLPAEVVKMKSKVKWMAEQLVVRLDKDFQVIFMILFMVTHNLFISFCVFLLNPVPSPAAGPSWPHTQSAR